MPRLADATYTRACQKMAEDVVYEMSFADMDSWRTSRSRLVKHRCGHCWKAIHKQRNGAWYHDRTSSVHCAPGHGDGRKAFLAAPRN